MIIGESNIYDFYGKMSDERENEEEEDWFRPVWETEDEPDPPGRPRPRKAAAEPDYAHPLLTPLARAQDAVARLQAKAELASPPVVEGLRARLSYLEAAGWLSWAHMWIHPLARIIHGSYWLAARWRHRGAIFRGVADARSGVWGCAEGFVRGHTAPSATAAVWRCDQRDRQSRPDKGRRWAARP
jgi:hypothetical protein